MVGMLCQDWLPSELTLLAHVAYRPGQVLGPPAKALKVVRQLAEQHQLVLMLSLPSHDIWERTQGVGRNLHPQLEGTNSLSPMYEPSHGQVLVAVPVQRMAEESKLASKGQSG